jgi:hypothetical protein
MIKTSLILASCQQHQSRRPLALKPAMTPVLALLLLTGGLGVRPAAASPQPPTLLAQAFELPPPATGAAPSYPAPPVNAYANGGGLPTAEQYIVYVPGSDMGLLDRLRLIEPGAFPTSHQGQSVIQVGRFSLYQNAQQQVNTLMSQGIGAQIGQVSALVPTYGQVPAPPPSTYISSGELPPLPVVAAPQGSTAALPPTPIQNVEFGQPPSAPASPAGIGEMPLPPSEVPTAALTPPTTVSAPFYVVIPAAVDDLPTISSRLIQLGAPADRVLQRQSRLGPNVAVGPFSDRGLAERWRGFFREAGYGSSRVVYEP